MRSLALLMLVALPLAQTTPSGGAISRYVPPVPTPASFVSDQRSVLSADARAEIDVRITAIQQAGLGDIAVAILPSIGDYAPNQVSVEIYRTWRVGSTAAIGSARRNVGVLLLIVPKELAPNGRGECFILTGLGAEGVITDGTAGSICRDSIVPHLRNKDYAGAVNAGISGIEARLSEDVGLAAEAETPAAGVAPLATQPGSSTTRPFPLGIVLFSAGGVGAAIASVFGVLRYRRNRPRFCSRCGRTMRRLDEKSDDAKLERGQVVEEKIGSVDYDVWVCDCGESLVVPYSKWTSSYSKCRECGRKAARSKRVTIMRATTVSTGLAEDRHACKACNATWTEEVVLPIIVPASSSRGDGGGGGGGGGGGSSFGGSGATSGGGGGSSY